MDAMLVGIGGALWGFLPWHRLCSGYQKTLSRAYSMCDCYMVSESGKEMKYLGFRLITLELRSVGNLMT